MTTSIRHPNVPCLAPSTPPSIPKLFVTTSGASGVQHLMPMAGIPRNATGLVFGRDVQDSLGAAAYVVGTGIHFIFACGWGVLFAFLWPVFRRRGYEATLVALFYAAMAWIVMHAAIMVVSSNHPNYYDPNVIIGGFMSHFFFTVPLALVVKRRLGAGAGG